MGKEILIFSIAFFLLFLNVMLLYMGLASGNEIGDINILSTDSLFKIGSIYFTLPPLIAIFFIALNIAGIAIIVMTLRGI